MKQLFQNLRTGSIEYIDVPVAVASAGTIVVATRCSLISAGTERMLNSFAKSGYIAKARQQPEKVKQVIQKAQTDGIVATFQAVSQKLDQPLPLGYSNVGVVVEAGRGSAFKPGDRVISNGSHAECVRVPDNLAVRIPDGVDDVAASFTVVGAIGLQGIRLIAPTLGETVCVAGLGLIGLLAVQMLKANGCRVFGFDPSPERVELARRFGAHAVVADASADLVTAAEEFTGGVGVDAVLITASTSSNDLISQCARMTRKRGRIVLTGVIGLDLNRADFYEKELTFQVSCSYGPGRYDHQFEAKGYDYPLAFVRWTETRNFEAVLELLRDGKLNIAPLATHEFAFEDGINAYAALSQPAALGVVLKYRDTGLAAPVTPAMRRVVYAAAAEARKAPASAGRIAVIGAGNYAQAMLLPSLQKAGADIRVVATTQGSTAAVAASRFNVPESMSDVDELMARPDIDAIVISTPHNTHAGLTLKALDAGKHVFVEKPLCLTIEELETITARMDTLGPSAPVLMVGFNRRFAPQVVQMKAALKGRTGPLFGVINCNAGAIPADHWTQDPERGGGRIIGEACHFIDLARFFAASPITRVSAMKVRPGGRDLEDTAAISLGFADGSLLQVNYFSTGSKAMPKETVMLSWDGRSVEMTNFLKLKGHGVSASGSSWTQDKGHVNGCAAFKAAITGGGDSPIPYTEVENVMRAALQAVEAMRTGAASTL